VILGATNSGYRQDIGLLVAGFILRCLPGF
jgi:hypothetical protein